MQAQLLEALQSRTDLQVICAVLIDFCVVVWVGFKVIVWQAC